MSGPRETDGGGPEEVDDGNAVAIVGLALRVPGADDAETFWANLASGVESITRFTDDDLLAAGVAPERLDDPRLLRSRGVLSDVDGFDAAFFDLSPNEATVLDPQHRLFLELAWAAMEDAGQTPGGPVGPGGLGTVGVFAGCGMSNHLFELARRPGGFADLPRLQIEIGNDRDHFATQVSYRLDLRGPSVTVQTGCSTSLVAVHLAAQSLLSYECDLALAGGISLALPQVEAESYVEGGVLSPDGHCRAFDAEAQGTVIGSGGGVVVLKRLDEALRDGDPIRAVLRGSAINNDGARKIGYTAPSVAGQAEVIAQALAMARVAVQDVTYVEAHGTGTPVGDPIELAALARIYGAPRGSSPPCAIGSVKTNLGHLNAGAGLAGLAKVVLMLERRRLVPSLYFARLNAQADLQGGVLFVNTELRPWVAREGAPLLAGISSFSIGGTNAHLILEEPPRATRPADEPAAGDRRLVVLSARTAAALEAATDRAADALDRLPAESFGDACFTLRSGRTAFPYRRTLVARDARDAAAALRERAAGRVFTQEKRSGHRPLVFLLPGQGAFEPGLGSGLYDHEAEFRSEVDRCAEILAGRLPVDLRDLFTPAGADRPAVSRTAIEQPWLFVFELALARLWRGLGVRPDVFLGHSLGELAAACLAGTFEVEEALALVVLRGELLAATPAGAMLSVALDAQEAALRGGTELALAAHNGPAASVLSGTEDAVARLAARLDAEGIAHRRLRVDRAFHSPLVASAAEPLAALAATFPRRTPSIPWISNVTGRRIEPDEATDPSYWGRHLTSTVRFADGLLSAGIETDAVFLEVGPGDALTRLARRHPTRAEGAVAIPSIESIATGATSARDLSLPESARFQAALGELWREGVEISWPKVGRRIALPTYPFERRSFVLPPRAARVEESIPSAPSDPAAPSVPATLENPRPAAQLRARQMRPNLATPYAPPRGEVEVAIAEGLAGLLGFEQVGRDDNFFELGGHSLLAVQLVNRLRSRFQVDLPLGAAFDAPSAAGLAARVAALQLNADEVSEIERLVREIEGLSDDDLKVALAAEQGGDEAPAAAPSRPVVASALGGPVFESVTSPARRSALRFSLFFFSDGGSRDEREKYRLLFECARWAEAEGFEAIWTPERHFQDFGGLYPNPAVLGAALAARTERLEIRAGSQILPLHHPVRVVEDWALLDNLTGGGRVGVSFATGWHPHDFALRPEAHADRRELLFDGIARVREIWKSGVARLPQIGGGEVEVRVLPRPLSPELPIWVTSSGTSATWRRAGEAGTHVLSAIVGDPGVELAERIALYRAARDAAGHDPLAGRVSVMVHTHLGTDLQATKEAVREPMTRYLRTFLDQGRALDLGALGLDSGKAIERDLAELAGFAFERFFAERSLLGTVAACEPRLDRWLEIGVDEVACLVDFGLPETAVLESLDRLGDLRRRHEERNSVALAPGRSLAG